MLEITDNAKTELENLLKTDENKNKQLIITFLGYG